MLWLNQSQQALTNLFYGLLINFEALNPDEALYENGSMQYHGEFDKDISAMNKNNKMINKKLKTNNMYKEWNINCSAIKKMSMNTQNKLVCSPADQSHQIYTKLF